MRLSRVGKTALLLLLAASVLIPGAVLLAAHLRPGAPRLVSANPPAAAVVAPAATAAEKRMDDGTVLDPVSGLRVIHEKVTFTPAPVAATVPMPPINAASGILVDIDSGQILWQQNAHTPLPPASTTKVMTALVILNNFSPAQNITITPSALGQASDESKMGLLPGETLSVEQLLQGMLLVSANDAATTLAVDTVGMPRFLEAMNAQEQALGLTDSHFATPVGLDTPGHAISAYDLATIADVDYNNFPEFRQIVGSQDVEIPATSAHHAFSLWNINQLVYTYPGAVGIKPGYTGNAGYCIVAMAERNGHRLVLVLMNAPYMYHQAGPIFDWGFAVDGSKPVVTTP